MPCIQTVFDTLMDRRVGSHLLVGRSPVGLVEPSTAAFMKHTYFMNEKMDTTSTINIHLPYHALAKYEILDSDWPSPGFVTLWRF